VKASVSAVGLDTPSPDREPFSIHRQLLGSGVLIIENLTKLEGLVGATPYEVIALPIKFQAEAAPARVIARMDCQY
jgi:kynurenine formamidase